MAKSFSLILAMVLYSLLVEAKYRSPLRICMNFDTIPNNLLYVVEGKEDYLIPYIEQKLRNLRHPNSDQRLFDSVFSLNALTQHVSIEARIIDLFNEAYSGSYHSIKELPVDSLTYYSQFLKSFSSVLAIKVTPLQDLVEFQFILYETIDSGKALKYINSSSVFINPRVSHYQADLIRTITQVFQKAIRPPDFKMTYNLRKADSLIYMSTDDSLRLEPIVTDESLEEDRIYIWSQEITDSNQAAIDVNKKNQTLAKLRPGRYKLYFKLSNSITYSRTDTIRLLVFTKPVLDIRYGYQYKRISRSTKGLIIVQNFLTRKADSIIYFTPYAVLARPRDFLDLPTRLTVKFGDTLRPSFEKSFAIRDSIIILNDLDSLPFENHLNSARVSITNRSTPLLSFTASNGIFESRTYTQEIKVVKRMPIALRLGYDFYPVSRLGLYNDSSFANVLLGINFLLTPTYNVSASEGSNFGGTHSFSRYHTQLFINRRLNNNRVEFGVGYFIQTTGNYLYTQAYGIRAALRFSTKSNIFFHTVYFTDFRNNGFLAVGYTGDLFLKH